MEPVFFKKAVIFKIGIVIQLFELFFRFLEKRVLVRCRFERRWLDGEERNSITVVIIFIMIFFFFYLSILVIIKESLNEPKLRSPISVISAHKGSESLERVNSDTGRRHRFISSYV